MASWERGYGDFHLLPDLATLRRIPWLEGTALVLCDVAWDDGSPVVASPRQVLAAQVERARAAGFEPMFGSELEFYLLKETYAEAHAQALPRPDAVGALHPRLPRSSRRPTTSRFIRQIRNGMQAAGIPVESSKGEAWPGQQEINFRYADALRMADNHVIYKNGAKEIAHANGCSITFMAKPDHTWIGSSCHIHASLWRDGENAFAGESEVFDAVPRRLDRVRAASWRCSSRRTINSYKRYAAGSWAPTTLAWGHDNRTCGFRIVGHGTAQRVETRIPGGDVNPYLAFAALIAAGLHGIEQGLELPPALEGNAYESDARALPLDAARGDRRARDRARWRGRRSATRSSTTT